MVGAHPLPAPDTVQQQSRGRNAFEVVVLAEDEADEGKKWRIVRMPADGRGGGGGGGDMDVWIDKRNHGWMDRWREGQMEGFTDERREGAMDGWMDGWMDERREGRMDCQMDGGMDGCLYIYLQGGVWGQREKERRSACPCVCLRTRSSMRIRGPGCSQNPQIEILYTILDTTSKLGAWHCKTHGPRA